MKDRLIAVGFQKTSLYLGFVNTIDAELLTKLCLEQSIKMIFSRRKAHTLGGDLADLTLSAVKSEWGNEMFLCSSYISLYAHISM
jgi:hypothetical protein